MKFAETVPLQLTSNLMGIPSGVEGVRVTLNKMREITRAGKKNIQIRQKAMELVQHLEQKDWRGEIEAIHSFVKNRIRYIRDIRGVETLAYPDITLKLGQGDCDDKSVLAASLLEAIGHPTRFVAVGFKPNHFSHVFPETKIGPHWLSVETTEPVSIGWQPPGIRAIMKVHN